MKKSIKTFMTLALISVFSVTIFACITKYSVTLETDLEQGSVTGDGLYQAGASVTVTATANDGYEFVGWLDGDEEVSNEADYTFQMPSEDVELVAVFKDANIAEALEEAKADLRIQGISSIANNNFSVVLSISVTVNNRDYEVAVAWESNKPDVIAVSGTNATVTRPVAGDEVVVLTATLSLGDEQTTKEFELLVMEAEETPEQALDRVQTLLEEQMATKGLSNVTADISLPSVIDVASIAWVSSDIDYLKNDGSIIRPINGDGDAEVTLTATLTVGGVNRDVAFTVVVKEGPAPADELRAVEASKYLNIQTNDVTDDLVLPLVGRFDTTIVWTSSNPDVIAADGTVTRQAATGEGYTVVTLTATISYEDQPPVNKSFVVQVLELEPSNDDQKINVAWALLDVSYISVSDLELTLPEEGEYGVTFTYSSTTDGLVVDGNVVTITKNSFDYFAAIIVVGSLNDTTVDFQLNFVVKSDDKGSGTLTNPFIITSVADLEKVGSDTDGWSLSAHYSLFSNIDLSEKYGEGKLSFTPIGGQNNPFTGTFDGNGFTISGLYINSTGTYVGLFGHLRGTVQNLIIDSATVLGAQKVGGAIGHVSNGQVINVHVLDSNIVAKGQVDSQVGGVIGMIDQSVVDNVTTDKIVVSQVSSFGNVIVGQRHIGGIVGRVVNRSLDPDVFFVDISDVYSVSLIYGKQRVGGLIGSFSGRLVNAVTGSQLFLNDDAADSTGHVGGAIGAIEPLSTVPTYTHIENVLMAGSIEAFLVPPLNGRLGSFIADVQGAERVTIVDCYITIEPYNGNGTNPYENGVKGVQISEENAKDISWLTNNMSFDFTVWALEGNYPFLQIDKTSALIVSSINGALRLPAVVSNDLELITETGLGGVVVSWTSDSDLIDPLTGEVTRPLFGNGDASATLTATYSFNDVVHTLEFAVTILEALPTTEEKQVIVEEEITDAIGDLAAPIKSNLDLLTAVSYGTVVWEVVEGPITTEGVISRPAVGSDDASFEIVAHITIDGITTDLTFSGLIMAAQLGLFATEEAIAAITIPAETTTDLDLLTTYNYDGDEGVAVVSIVWSLKDGSGSIDPQTGVVTRPSYLDGDETVTLVATFSNNQDAYTTTLEYVVTVLKLDASSEDLYEVAVDEVKTAIGTALTGNVDLSSLGDENVSIAYEVTVGNTNISVVDAELVVLLPSILEAEVPFELVVTVTATAPSDVAFSDSFHISGLIKQNVGDGSVDNPFKIATVDDYLSGGRSQSGWKANMHYEFLGDVDFTATHNATTGLKVPSITQNNITIHGNGHTITGLYVVSTGADAGMFSVANVITVSDLNFVDSYVEGTNNIGTLAGRVRELNATNISIVNGIVKTSKTSGDTVAGGLVGIIDSRDGVRNGEISNIYVDCDVYGFQHNSLLIGQFRHNKEGLVYNIHDIEVHGTLTSNVRTGSIIGTIMLHSAENIVTQELNKLVIYNVVSYAIIELASTSGTLGPNGGLFGFIERGSIPTDGTNQLEYDFHSLVFYGSIDAENGAAHCATGVGRIQQKGLFAGMIDEQTIFTVQEPFAKSGEGIAGVLLESTNISDQAWYLANLDSFDLAATWRVTESGLSLQ